MVWSLKATSKKVSWLQKLKEERGIRVRTLEDKPELFPDNEWIWEAFHTCSTTRDWVDGIPQRVKITEIESYGRIKQINLDDMPFLMGCILMLDSEYTNATIKDQQKEAAKQARKGQRRTPRRGR